MKKNEEIIKSLIKDDLTHLKLILGLKKIRLGADDYNLNLSDSIINLINKNLTDEQKEMVHRYYCNITNRIVEYELSSITIEMKVETIYIEINNQVEKLI